MNDAEKIKKVREEIHEVITYPTCKKCQYWDRQGHYCYSESVGVDLTSCELLDKILAIDGLVVKSDDQNLPEYRKCSDVSDFYNSEVIKPAFRDCFIPTTPTDMLKDGWIKPIRK